MKKTRTKFLIWLGFEMLLPVMFVVGLWPFAEDYLHIPYAFEKVLSGSDLLPIGALILIGVILETVFNDSVDAEETIISIQLIIATILVFALLVLYGLLKSKYFEFDFSVLGTPKDDGTISSYSQLSISTITFCCIFAVSIKLTGIYLMKKQP